MRLLIIILSIVALAACQRKQYPQFLVTQVKDTTITRIEYRDTVIRIPAKQVQVSKTIPDDCPDFDTTVKKGATTVQISKKGSELKVNCKEDSLRLIIAGLNKQIDSFTSITHEVPVPVEKKVPYIPRWVWWVMAVLAALAAWGNRNVIVKLFKLVLSFG